MELDHVQVAMPAGGEDAARRFYTGLLGLTEVPKPESLLATGGVWFEPGVHMGVETDFRPARKAHPGLTTTDLDAVAARLARPARMSNGTSACRACAASTRTTRSATGSRSSRGREYLRPGPGYSGGGPIGFAT